MLANQYFMTERYLEACELYKKVLSVNSSNSIVKKKLLSCFVLTGKLSEAMDIFTQLILKDFEILLENEDGLYGTPCIKMISELESCNSDLSETDKIFTLGVLWMYCDINTAKSYFDQLILIIPNDNKLQTVIKLINHLITLKKEK